MKTCETCKFWEVTKETQPYQMGKCLMLSGKNIPKYNKYLERETTDDIHPDDKITGISSCTLCQFDGLGFYYETKAWFGCIHHKAKE
jgi:hypothetical protein